MSRSLSRLNANAELFERKRTRKGVMMRLLNVTQVTVQAGDIDTAAFGHT